MRLLDEEVDLVDRLTDGLVADYRGDVGANLQVL